MGWLAHNPEALDEQIIDFLYKCGYDYFASNFVYINSPTEMLIYLFPYSWPVHFDRFEWNYFEKRMASEI